MYRIIVIVITAFLFLPACKQPPEAPKPATTPPQAVKAAPAVKDSIEQVIDTFVEAMKEGNETKAKTALALEFFEQYSLPRPVVIKQHTYLERRIMNQIDVDASQFVTPPQVGDVRVDVEMIMAGNQDFIGTFWMRKINDFWKIYAWGLN